MRIRFGVLAVRHVSRHAISTPIHSSRRALVTLAIETSCDDTSVAVLEKRSEVRPGQPRAVLHFHKKITADNAIYNGVHPVVALESHQTNLAKLVNEAIGYLPPDSQSEDDYTVPLSGRDGSNHTEARRRPDFVSVTRGPGMRSNLFTGLDTAKGLAVAWQVDLVGVHHMQAHALTPRLVSALQPQLSGIPDVSTTPQPEPRFPFLSILASGGHTMLLHSASLTDHKMLATTTDVAIGDCLDKIARMVLPPEIITNATTPMYGALLEEFAFSGNPTAVQGRKPSDSKIETQNREAENPFHQEDTTAEEYCAANSMASVYDYTVPRNGEEAFRRGMTKWGWSINQPLSKGAGGLKSKSLEMSFAGMKSAVERLVEYGWDKSTGKLSKTKRSPSEITLEERRAMARESMRAAFEHLANRVVLGLDHIAAETSNTAPIATIVMSGGVAANRFLRYILASVLTARGLSGLRIVFPPPSLCTDNAAMIAWAGLEMYQAGYTDCLSIRAVRKWPFDQLLSPSYAD